MSLDPFLKPVGRSRSVTVIMPAFNAARTIRRAIDSLRAQSVTDWRLVCIDDASTDDTPEIIASLAGVLGDRLLTLRSEVNGGPARARNRGLAVAEGTWVAILDADDAWRPDRLESLLGDTGSSDADVLCDNLIGYDDHRQRETETLFTSLPQRLDIASLVAAEYQGLYNLGYLKPLVRRSFLQAHGIRYDELLRTGEDLLFLLSCLTHGARASCHSRSGYIYTTPVGQGSGKLSRSTTTTPRDADLADALYRFLALRQSALTLDETDAINRRIAYLEAIAPLAIFRHARLSHDWGTALKLFVTRPQVRRQVWAKLRGTPGSAPRKGT